MPTAKRRRWLRRLALALAALLLALAALFAANGLDPGWRAPESGRGAGEERTGAVRELRVMAFNIAKGGLYEAGVGLRGEEAVRARLARVADAIRAERCDVVFLQEVVTELGWWDLDQVAQLARACGFPHWASSENYSFGLPFLRIRSGNAVLSRLPLAPLEVQQLAGGSAFWNPTGNRRALWCEVGLDGGRLLVASIRNDSFDLANNLVQTRELLAFQGERPALLAGDFNAAPDTPPMRLLRASGRFTGFADGPPTFPAPRATRRIDQILAPAAWTLLEHRVLDTRASDHLAVVSVFRLP